MKGMIFYGFVSMIDPPRPNVPKSVLTWR